ncbi:GmrSD restriction endonuclease domain-containing protein [Pimelobacter simplex]|uniref:GmrSD restriction endonuclease domain-containing protein n=1 Tax=Nocardioides simplex TaxID=2045 RepID=UPI003AB0F485
MSKDVSSFDGLEAQLGVERRKVDVAAHNFSVRELVRMMVDGEMNIAPEYQRKFRWTPQNEATFVESVFLGLPVPPLFVATNADFEWEVVDGLQRLSTLVHFTAGSADMSDLIGRDLPLELEGLEKLSILNGKSFEDLPRQIQIYFSRQPLQVIALTDKSDLEVRFDLFERLNGGSISLSAQEVRACVYRGEFNLLIEKLAMSEPFASLLKLQKSKQSDATNVEQVLKFFAYKNSRDRFDGRVTDFLNEFMHRSSEGSFNYSAETKLFQGAAEALYLACESGPYVRSDFGVTPLVQFEASFVAAANLISNGVSPVVPPRGWTDDPALKAASMGGTNTRNQLRLRIERAEALLAGDA